MDKEIQIVYKPNIENLTKVSKYLLLNTRIIKFVPLYFGFIVLLIYISRLGAKPGYENEGLEFSKFLPFMILIFAMVLVYFRSLSAMKKNILNNKRNFETQKITFNNNSYIQEGDTFKVESFWNETFKIKETKDWFLIYPKKNSALPIVKSDLKPNEYKELKVLFSSLPIKKSLK